MCRNCIVISAQDSESTQIHLCVLLTTIMAPPRPDLSSGVSSTTLLSALRSVLNSSKSAHVLLLLLNPPNRLYTFFLFQKLPPSNTLQHSSKPLNPKQRFKTLKFETAPQMQTKYLPQDGIYFPYDIKHPSCL